MNMATTTTVQRDDSAECREKFEAWYFSIRREYLNGGIALDCNDANSMWIGWQAAWKAARGV
jgi:hypothetical protein